MGKVLKFVQQRQIEFQDYIERELAPNEVRLKTIYSGISAGTQLSAYRGTNPFAFKKWNDELKMFERAENGEIPSLYPVEGGWAYEEVGEVIETGRDVKNVKNGDIIYGTWGHRTTNIVTEEFACNHRLLEGLDPITGIFSQMGCIALNAILDADIHVGETVAIFGQGVPGQIISQLAKLNGARVIAVDLDDYRLDFSKKFGADVVLNSNKCDAAKEIKIITGNKGADVAIEISGSTMALHEAIRCAAYSGRVVCSGFMQGNANGLFLGEEFHHNRISIICSQINAVSPHLSYRWDRLRMENVMMELEKQNRINMKGLITKIVPFQDAAGAYEMLDKKAENCLQVVLKF